MIPFLEKKINKIKLTLTTKCNLSCPYCFVKKTNKDMDWDTAKRAVDILINSIGKEKLLSMYGGEPLINYDLIKKILPYSDKVAKKNKKNLTISICTNTMLLDREHVDLFNRYNVRVVASLAGQKEQHNRERILKDRTGTYDLVVKKLNILKSRTKKGNLGISFCLFPDNVCDLYKNFLYLVKSGFNHINFEIIRDYKIWGDKDIMIFIFQYKKIVRHILSELRNNNYIFINPINWELRTRMLSNKLCPFNYLMEVYPGGDVAFSPFLLNKSNKEDYILANIRKGKIYRLGECSFSFNDRCFKCRSAYFKKYKSDVAADLLHKFYDDISLVGVNYILKNANKKQFKNYISKAKKICF